MEGEICHSYPEDSGSLNMSKVFIIGKTGQLGSELAKVFDDTVTPDMSALDITKTNDTERYILDLKPNVIINTSAYQDLHQCEKNPHAAFFMNWIAVRNLALTAKRINALFVHFSTNYVFDGLKTMPYKEEDETNPAQIYGISKLAGEESILRHYPENSLVIRTSVLFGGSGSPEKGNFILNRIKESKSKKLTIDSEQVFSITYAKDLALAVKKIIEDIGVKNCPGIYHMVNDGICSWFDLTKYVFDLIYSDCRLESIARHGIDGKVKRPIYTPFSTEKIMVFEFKLPKLSIAISSIVYSPSSLDVS